MNVYDQILEGISQQKSNSQNLTDYLMALQSTVRNLRAAYRRHPVYVPYHKEDIQNAYLLTYLPHYYQLVQKILQERDYASYIEKDELIVTFIGGGPGSEAFGVIKYLLEHKPNIKRIEIYILDINASTWAYSHKIVLQELVNFINTDNIQIDWKSCQFDLINESDIHKNISTFKRSDLVVIQNCINEIDNSFFNQLNQNICQIYSNIVGGGSLLMVDLTSSVRSKIKNIEQELSFKYNPANISSTLKNSSPSSIVSVNTSPSNIIRNYLLTGDNGLIPRKHLKYDFSLLSKSLPRKINKDKSAVGFTALYKPFEESNLAVIDEVFNKVFIGVDFGTSVTVVSICYVEDGKVLLKTLSLPQKDHNGFYSNSPLIPTVMGVYNRHFMLGKHAAEHLPDLEIGKTAWAYFKEDLGVLESINYDFSILKNHKTYPISNGKEGLIIYFKLLLEAINKKVSKIKVNSDLFYTWSVPANYSLTQKNELKECASEAGFPMDDALLVEEPISALINYVYETNAVIDYEDSKTILILDIGAGTVDVSVLGVSSDSDNINSELLSVERISEIGGNKINQMMINILQSQNSNLRKYNNLRFFCERLKRRICKDIITDKTVEYKLPVLAYSNEIRNVKLSTDENLSMSFKEFYAIMYSYWSAPNSSITTTIQSALEKAKLTRSDINQVILTGGGGRNPYIKSFCKSFFGSADLIVSDNIQEQVARGNALQSFAQHVFGKNIINSLLHNDVLLCSNNEETVLFKKGEVCPTLDYDITDVTDNIVIKYGNEKLVFYMSEISIVEKITIYVDSDLSINCELVKNNSVEIINPQICAL